MAAVCDLIIEWYAVYTILRLVLIWQAHEKSNFKHFNIYFGCQINISLRNWIKIMKSSFH